MRRFKNFVMSAFLGIAAASMMAISAFAIDKDIVIIHTNDTHCGIEDNLGFEGLAAYKKQMLALTPYVTLVDAGDAIQGAPVGTLTEGGAIIQLMNQAGYDFAIPGNHEFDYGMERFLSLSNRLNCGYYSCNLTKGPGNGSILRPYKLVDYDDVTVAYVGVTTPESITKSTPTYFQDKSGRYIYGFCDDTTGDTLYKQVQKAVDSARGEGADYVVLVGHLGDEGTTDYWTSKKVIANTNGIDIAIDGHSHETFTLKVPNKDGVMVPLTQTGTKFANIGKITITPAGEITVELVDAVTDAEGNPAKDPEMADVIADVKSHYEESLKTVLGHTDVALTSQNPETNLRAVRKAETNLGDFLADAYKNLLNADIGFVNGGGIRSSIDAGTITFQDALEVYPFGNMLCMVEITGQQIKDALEMGASSFPEESGGFIQVSGLTYTIDSSVRSTVQKDSKGNFAGVTGEYRVKDIFVGEEPLDLNKTYTLASHNYWLKSGGDGMSMFLDCPVLRDEVMVDVDSITTYIKDYLGGVVGEEYSNPYGQGRITIK